MPGEKYVKEDKNKLKMSEKIKYYREQRKQNKVRFKNLITVKRPKRICEALCLPKVLNLNPRSLYNKIEQFVTFVKEEEVTLTCISESWEQIGKPLKEIINLENHEIISNVHQRNGVGGRPAIIVDTKHYNVENLTQSAVSIPWGVEAVWALLTPKNTSNKSMIQKIVVGALYSKPDSRKKSLLHDHISQVYNQLCSKYAKGLHWIICGDTNDLKLDPILHLNKNLKQVVQDPTRLNPPRILDPIITTLSRYYQKPKCLPPLDPDTADGKPSDHMMVLMEPISILNNQPARMKREIIYRPYKKENLQKMWDWMKTENWDTITHEETAHKKAVVLQQLLLSKYHQFFPEKKRVISSDDQPYFSEKLATLKRKKCREYSRNRKSKKWETLNAIYVEELSKAKRNFYQQKIKKLRTSKPKQWHRELKKLTSFDQHKSANIIVESIKDLTSKEQAEKIADKFAEVSQQYEEIKPEEIDIPFFSDDDIPEISEAEVTATLMELDVNKSDVKDDIPAKILKEFAPLLGRPVADLINTCIKQGAWPDIFKLEMVTPVPKVQGVPKNVDELRNISGLMNLDKIAEKLIAKKMISDMKDKIEPSQYANQKGLSIQHYLVKFIDRILEGVEKSEACAVLATLVDWKQAFPHQCPTLGVKSFVQNGVRPALIPLLINYFQGRRMKVKWQGEISNERKLKGGGPQGSTFGLWEYLSQSNSNADCISESDRFKFVDDLSFLELIHLLTVGLASFNIKQQIPSNIPEHNQIIPAKNLKSQKYLDYIDNWTDNQKMKLNIKKTKNMIFNFSKKFKFSTQLSVKNENIELIKEAKLLGTFITDDLRWNKNTAEIVKKAYMRMQLLNRAASFTKNTRDLKSIYLTYIRSILEQSAVVWHSSLSSKNRKDLERVQKTATKIILGKKYLNYQNALKTLNIDNLDKRRGKICLKFANNCLKNEKVKNLFPKSEQKHGMKLRKERKFKTNKNRTERYRKSAIPYMQELLNIEYMKKRLEMKEI